MPNHEEPRSITDKLDTLWRVLDTADIGAHLSGISGSLDRVADAILAAKERATLVKAADVIADEWDRVHNMPNAHSEYGQGMLNGLTMAVRLLIGPDEVRDVLHECPDGALCPEWGTPETDQG